MSDKGHKDPVSIGQIIVSYGKQDPNKYVSREFQQYGLELAEELNDLEHKSLYIKLAKENKRSLLESARRFVKDANNAKSKARLFMWKLGKLKSEKKD